MIVCIHFPLKHTMLAYSCKPISSNACAKHRFCRSNPIICSDCPRRALIIVANCSQNPSKKQQYVRYHRTAGQQSTLRHCFCTEHKTRFAVSYTLQARDRFHTTNAICPSHLLSYALLTLWPWSWTFTV